MPNITPITPPRVPLIDSRTGLIDRAWYLFFLSLSTTQQAADNNPDLGPSVESQIATYDAALRALAQATETQPSSNELLAQIAEMQKQIEALASGSQNFDTSELEKQIQALAVTPAPLVQLPWSSVLNQPKIEAYDTSVSIALTSTPALLKPASTTSGSQGIVYDAATGEFTFSAAGSYSLALSVNAVSAAANQVVYIYAENDTGAGWTVNTNSGKTYELINANMVQIVYAQAVGRVAGQKVRYWIYSNDGKVTLETFSLPGGVGAIVPAIRIQYS